MVRTRRAVGLMDRPPAPGESRIEPIDGDTVRVVWTSQHRAELFAVNMTLDQLAAMERGELPPDLETPECWSLDEQLEITRAAGDHLAREIELMRQRWHGLAEGEWDAWT